MTDLAERYPFVKELCDSPFWSSMGLRVVDMDEGFAVVHLDLVEQHRGGGPGPGAVNGGVVAYACDGAGGAAVASLVWPQLQATVTLSLTYLDGLFGDRLVAVARVRRSGSRLVFVDIEVSDDADKLCATAHAVYRVFTGERSSG